MEEMSKNKFESLYQLSEQNWRDWDHKTKHEWKLSFGIWATLLAINSVLYSQKYQLDILNYALFLLLGSIVILHFCFLKWIQSKLNIFRRRMIYLQKKMNRILLVKTFRIDSPEKFKLSFSFWTQFSITMVLAILSVFIFLNKSNYQYPINRNEIQHKEYLINTFSGSKSQIPIDTLFNNSKWIEIIDFINSNDKYKDILQLSITSFIYDSTMNKSIISNKKIISKRSNWIKEMLLKFSKVDKNKILILNKRLLNSKTKTKTINTIYIMIHYFL